MEKSNVEKFAEKIIEENNRLKEKIEEMQHHIDCLKSDLAEAQNNKNEFPLEPIKVAEMLICNVKTTVCEDSAYYTRMFTKSGLRQIAEHLLVHCNNSDDGE